MGVEHQENRSAEAMAFCRMLYFSARSRKGRKNMRMYEMNATRAPRLSVSLSTWPPPYHTISATAATASTSTSGMNTASTRICSRPER
jgi:hypothetical protein